MATAVFDDGSEEPCVTVEHDDGMQDVLRQGHFRTLSELEKHDLDAYYLVMEMAHAFLQRTLAVGLEA